MATVVGGKLKLKGAVGKVDGDDKSRKRKVDSSAPHDASDELAGSSSSVTDSSDQYLTAAQKRHKQKKAELDKIFLKKNAKLSYRERVDALNNRLANMSEHNDIPRVSAAGNG
jgi:protein FAM32A